MLQVTLFQRIESLLSVMQNAETLMKVINAFEREYDIIQNNMNILFEGSQDGGTRNNQLSVIYNRINDSVGAIKKDYGSRRLMKEISEIEEKIQFSLRNEFHEVDYLKSILNKIDDFANAYDKYISHSIVVNAYQLLNASHEFKKSISLFKDSLFFALKNISNDYECLEGEMAFSITLAYAENPKDFAEKILAINALYDELCFLLNVSQAESPLRIGKIESGSLFTKLFGDTRVVGLLCSFVERGFDYLHRNYTKEGRIASIPKQLEASNSILDYVKELEKSGVDVSEAKDSLAKGAAIIADNLNILIKGQSSIEINGKQFGNKAEQQALIEKNRDLRISYEEKSPIETGISTAEGVKIAPNPSN